MYVVRNILYYVFGNVAFILDISCILELING